MEITFDDYVKNPTGGRSHMVGERDAAKAVYTDLAAVYRQSDDAGSL